jgi:predicted PurR-regulated permease PerM
VLLLEHARPLLLPVTIAIVFTFVLSAPVRMLQRRGHHRIRGAAIVIAAVLALVVLIFALIAAPAAAWWSRAPVIVQELVEALQNWRDALFPYAAPAPLTRGPMPAGSAERPLNERLRHRGLDLHPAGDRRHAVVRGRPPRRR